MRDKLFMTFLCATLCVVTNAMGADLPNGGSWNKVRESIDNGCKAQKMSLNGDHQMFKADSDVSSYEGFGISLYMLEESDDYLFVGTNSALMCDTYQMGEFYECEGNIVVTNGSHFFECKIGGTDKWEEVYPKTCSKSMVPFGAEKSRIVGVDATYVKENKGYTIATSDLCVMRDCIEGYVYFKGECVYVPDYLRQRECEQLIESGKATGWDDKNNACLCKDAANAEWKNNDCVCKDTNANMDSKGMCVCKDEGMEFDKDGKCVKKVAESNAVTYATDNQDNENPEKTACEGLISSGRATKWDDANNTCLCKDTTNAEWKDNDCVCKDSENLVMDMDGMCKSNEDVKESKDEEHEGKAEGNNNQIEELGKWLDAQTEKFERSKWRDAEGKFNTARLASDSIAGVVLGTAGGLISSKVIKKKQVENGFEDIKCTVGSQEVADWGDEFQVGIQ